jgi:flagellar protein FliS
VQLVIILYEQGIEDLRRAILALEKNDIEARTHEINHALMVVGQLQSSLDMEHGGEVAMNLQRFYNVVRGCLIEAQVTQSARILEEQIAHLVLLHEAWVEVERTAAPSQAQSTQPQPSTVKISAVEASLSDWQA